MSRARMLGKYELVRLIGRGGMGEVYEGRNPRIDRRVAIKLLKSSEAAPARKDAALSRFLRETMLGGRLQSPYIAQVLDADEDPEGNPYMVMEYLDGEDLSQVLRRNGPLLPEVAIAVIAQACLGVEKAHREGVVHSDIKPANLFLSTGERGEVVVKILDFGIAKVTTHAGEREKLTQTGSVLGSPYYMSREQIRGRDLIDHRTDIWSLGAVLYELLTGVPPYHDATHLNAIIAAILEGPPRPVQDLASWVPPEAVGVVDGAMQADVARRFQTATAMLEFIRRFLPNGWSLHEKMFVRVPENVRARVAARATPAILRELTVSGRSPASPRAGTPRHLIVAGSILALAVAVIASYAARELLAGERKEPVSASAELPPGVSSPSTSDARTDSIPASTSTAAPPTPPSAAEPATANASATSAPTPSAATPAERVPMRPVAKPTAAPPTVTPSAKPTGTPIFVRD